MITPQASFQFDWGPGGDQAEEERTEIVDFLKALECFAHVAAYILERGLIACPPRANKTLMPETLAGESGVLFI